MKLVVMIPAYNEEASIASVIKEIPRKIRGISKVEVLVIDDGSTDNTANEAKIAGADKVVSHTHNLGLGNAFRTGLDNALEMGADIIVNTDADGQYVGAEIPDLIGPIFVKRADMVLGSRFAGSIEHMVASKKIGNRMATRMVRYLSGIPITDGQTGFRALTRDAALKLNVMSNYTYTQETIIQAAMKGLKIVEIPVTFRKREGYSKLVSSPLGYAKKSATILFRTYRDYKPLKFFGAIGGIVILIGLILGVRVIYHYLTTGLVSPMLPTAILSAMTMIVGFQVLVFAFMADMMGQQRRTQEEILYRIKKNIRN